jgi:hypothetical protein
VLAFCAAIGAIGLKNMPSPGERRRVESAPPQGYQAAPAGD